jgi:hypothetical protein
MISEAIVDCYKESEQAVGLFTMVEENLRLPFSTIVLGIQVNVQKVELNDAGEIVAVCSRGPEKQRILLLRKTTRMLLILSVHPWNGEPECGSRTGLADEAYLSTMSFNGKLAERKS